jgi:large subunit ribosomal protein L13
VTARTVEIDAAGQVLGRLATRIALALRGKDQASYRPDRLADVQVKVTNVKQLKFTGRKGQQKQYYNFSGYPGGLKTERLDDLFARRPDRVLKLAVRNMLPKNRLRAAMLKHLEIT